MSDEVSTPPGWYDDGSGHLRWWDGRVWGQYAPAPAPVPSVTMAVLSHVGIFLGSLGFIVPLVAYLNATDDRFTRGHARESLNFQITMALAWVAGLVVAIPLVAVGGSRSGAGRGGLVALGVLVFAALVVFAIAGIVFSILGAVAASRRERYRYPICIRLVGRNEAAAEGG